MYFGGIVTNEGRSKVETHRWIQADGNCERVMTNRNIANQVEWESLFQNACNASMPVYT